MKNGTYKVILTIDLFECADEEEARNAVADMLSGMLDDDEFPEVDFELVEELDMEYNTEDNIPELNFEEAI